MVCCDLTLNGSLFHSTCTPEAKPHLPMAFLGWTWDLWTEETDHLFPFVRLLDDRYFITAPWMVNMSLLPSTEGLFVCFFLLYLFIPSLGQALHA